LALVQKSWPKNTTLAILPKIDNFIITFEGETFESQSKAQKTWILA